MGRFGKVYVCKLEPTGHRFAAKLVDLPRTFEDDCVLFDLYSEVTVMERMRYDTFMQWG